MLPSAGEQRYVGTSLSGGVARGQVCRFVAPTPVAGPGPRSVAAEEKRLRAARSRAIAHLEWLARDVDGIAGPAEAAILRVQSLMLGDEALWDAFASAIEDGGTCAEDAVATTFGRFRTQLARAGQAVLDERVGEVDELERALLTELGRAAPSRRCRDAGHCTVGHCQLRNPHILLLSELTPALVMEVDDLTLGLVTGRGARTSHAAIMARTMALPCVSLGDEARLEAIPLDADLLIDGDRGEVIVSPCTETLAGYDAQLRCGPRKARVTQPVPGLQVLANVERTADLDAARAARAEGVGLYRTEVEALQLGRLLDEDEQCARYTAVVDAVAGGAAYIRLLDLGGDKSGAFLGLGPEENPALGLRGARLLLARPEMLRGQVRALARASRRGTIHVIAPMVIDVEQMRQLREIVRAEADRIPGRSLLLGAMLEVPSACIQARAIMEAADFACVGTNDLSQYLFAMDRANAAVAMEGAHHHPALWAVLEDLARAARETRRGLSVCGELAGDAALTRRLMGAGIRQVSVAPPAIAEVRIAARAFIPRATAIALSPPRVR